VTDFNEFNKKVIDEFRANGGKVGEPFEGAPMILVTHKGAKSGVERTTPLVYTTDGDRLVIIASKAGSPNNPAWFHNLVANPDVTIQVGTSRKKVHARVATAPERERLWPKVVENYGGFEGYQQRTEREIPLVILEPR